MRKITLLLSFAVLLCVQAWSQTVPMGMKYQAVARDLSGKVLSSQELGLQIQLYSDIELQTIEYAETHAITTNEVGLFTLVVGEGTDIKGSFEKVPWSTHDIWMVVSIRDDKAADFITISKSKLLTVPYAFHAATAAELINPDSRNAQQNGVPANVWSLFGNTNTDPEEDKLGTADCADLVMVTNNIERLRITCAGVVNIVDDLNVGADLDVGNDVHIGNDLTVDQDVFLNVDGGNTTVNGDLTVANMSATKLTGTLEVDGATDLNSTLNVDGTTTLNDDLTVTGMSPTLLTGTLTVDKATDLNSTLNVDGTTTLNDDLTVTGMNPTLLTGTLTVDKATDLNSTLNVDGTTTLNDDLTVTGMNPTLLTGTLTVDKATDLNSTLNVDGTSTLNDDLTVTGMNPTYLTGTLEVDKATNLNSSLTVDGATDLNSTLNVDGASTLNNTLNVTAGTSYIANFTNTTNANGITIKVANADPGSGNNFVSFLNSGGTTQGRIEGQTHAELITSFDYIWFQTMEALHTIFAAALIVVDLVGVDDFDAAAVEGLELATAIAEWLEQGINMELNVGVAFESGSGDYAEWLKKASPDEVFSYGDIVAVHGGTISRSIEGADKFMVISKSPIVLGNMPEPGNEEMYEMVAFMGQVPVKVRGDVSIGDYIVASALEDGFGVAIAPQEMRLEDYSKIVGIAWSESDGEKAYSLINTAIGINNNDLVGRLSVQQKEIDDVKVAMNNLISYLQARDPNFNAEIFSLPDENSYEVADLNSAEVDNLASASHDNKMATIAQLLNQNPEFLQNVMRDTKALLDEKGIDYNRYEQISRLLNDQQYFISMLTESSRR